MTVICARGLGPLLLLAMLASAAAGSPRTVVHESPTGITESCRLMPSFPFLPPDVELDANGFAWQNNWFQKEDAESIAAMCAMDLYQTADAENAPAVGVCPKIHGTTPGLEFYDLSSAGLGKQEFESRRCKYRGRLYSRRKSPRRAKKLAKFKTDVFNNERQAMLLYFHFSRLLGNLGFVLPATARTIARPEYKRLTANAIKFLGLRLHPREGWEVVQGFLRTPPRRARRTYRRARARIIPFKTPDLVLGTLMENPRGERPRRAFCFSARTITGGDDYRRAPYFRLVSAKRPIADVLHLDSARSDKYRRALLQKLSCARDFTHMVILDHLFKQLDRLGNIHEQTYYHFFDERGRLDWKKKRKKDRKKKPGTVPLTRLLLKDNEDALVWKYAGPIVGAGLLSNIRHLDPLVYERMQWLAGLMRDPATADAVKRYFVDSVNIPARTYESVRKRYLSIAARFEKLHAKGCLHLDFDLEAAVRLVLPQPSVEEDDEHGAEIAKD